MAKVKAEQAAAVEAEEPKQITLFCFATLDKDGKTVFSMPMEKDQLDAGIKQQRLAGKVCACVIVPLFDTNVTVDVPWHLAKDAIQA
jgi:hypothetical protein